MAHESTSLAHPRQVVSASRSPLALRHGSGSSDAALRCSGAALFGAAGGFGRSRGCGSGVAGGSQEAVVPGGFQGVPGGWLEQMTVSELGRLFSMLYSRQSHHIKDPVDFCLKILLGDSSSSFPHKKILLVCFSLLPSSIFTFFRSSDSMFQCISCPKSQTKSKDIKKTSPPCFP